MFFKLHACFGAYCAFFQLRADRRDLSLLSIARVFSESDLVQELQHLSKIVCLVAVPFPCARDR